MERQATYADCRRPTRCADAAHRREYRQRWLDTHPGYYAARAARLRAEGRRCAINGCPEPAYISPGGFTARRCTEHEAEKRRLLYTPRPHYADHAEGQGMTAEQYAAAVAAQDGRCPCCRRRPHSRARWWPHDGAMLCHRCRQLVPKVAALLAEQPRVVRYVTRS